MNSPYYLPYEDTFPARCAEYQWCVNGAVTARTCAGDTEFTQHNGDNPCDTPSNSTYCGQRRSLLTTTSPGGTSAATGGLCVCLVLVLWLYVH